MREYESVFVLNPNLDETQVDAEVEKIKDFLASNQSEVTEVQKWGRRKLAYEVAKNREGVYTLIRFNAGAEVPKELDRRYRLNENMLRFLTVQYERPPVGEGEEAADGSETQEAAAPGTPVPPRAEETPAAEPAPAAAETVSEEPVVEQEAAPEETAG